MGNDKGEDEKDEKKAKKARRVSVSVAPPQITMQQMEQMAKGGIIYDMDMMNDLMAQTYASAVKWPKDQILAIRVEHIVKCVISGKYPVEKGHSLGEILAELQDTDNVPFDSKNPDSNLRESSSTPAGSESSDLSRKNESKIRQLLTSGQITKYDENEDDPVSRLAKARGLSGVEITPVNGDTSEGNGKEVPNFIADLQKKSAAKKRVQIGQLGIHAKAKIGRRNNRGQ